MMIRLQKFQSLRAPVSKTRFGRFVVTFHLGEVIKMSLFFFKGRISFHWSFHAGCSRPVFRVQELTGWEMFSQPLKKPWLETRCLRLGDSEPSKECPFCVTCWVGLLEVGQKYIEFPRLVIGFHRMSGTLIRASPWASCERGEKFLGFSAQSERKLSRL